VRRVPTCAAVHGRLGAVTSFSPGELRVRHGLPSDGSFLCGLMDAEGMATDADPTEFVVAEASGRYLGAARVETVGDKSWIRPLVVADHAQRRGVGRALVGELASDHGRLYVVARGAAVGFYERAGFAMADWGIAPDDLRAECDACSDFAQCRPAVLVRPA